jgi:hypothetical protein
MKKAILLTLTLAIMLGCTSFTACGGEKGGLTWDDIPVYPGAELIVTRNWSELPQGEPLSEVEWRYYLAGDKYSVSEIASFYESEMPAEGWQDISEMESGVINEALWSYHKLINLYTQVDIVGRMGDWGYYNKNGEKDWAAIWMGINREWEEADKTYIVIMIAR